MTSARTPRDDSADTQSSQGGKQNAKMLVCGAGRPSCGSRRADCKQQRPAVESNKARAYSVGGRRCGSRNSANLASVPGTSGWALASCGELPDVHRSCGSGRTAIDIIGRVVGGWVGGIRKLMSAACCNSSAHAPLAKGCMPSAHFLPPKDKQHQQAPALWAIL